MPEFRQTRWKRRAGGLPIVRFEAMLKQGEERCFTVAAGFSGQAPQRHAAFDRIVEKAERHWSSQLQVSADFGMARANDIFRSLQYMELQLLLNPWKDAPAHYLQPCQGGSSERFYVWVWEAMEALRPMVRLGHDDKVRKVLEYILKLQDGGCSPKGEFTTLSGAIGTTGPQWANTTGAALARCVANDGDEGLFFATTDSMEAYWLNGNGHCPLVH